MSHLDEGQIHALLDGELTPAERSQAEEHLGGCAECRQLLVEAKTFFAEADRLVGSVVPTPVRAASETPAPARTTSPLRRYQWLAWAATVVLAVGLGFFGRKLDQPAVVSDVGTSADQKAANEITAAPVQTPPMAPDPAQRAQAKQASPGDKIRLRGELQTAPAEAPAPSAPPAAGAVGGERKDQDMLKKNERDSEARPAVRLAEEPMPRPKVLNTEIAEGFQVTSLEDAVRVLGGSVLLIDGLTPQLVLVGPDSLLSGSRADRKIIRVVYEDPPGRQLWLDQQRLETEDEQSSGLAASASKVSVLPGDTLVAPAAQGASRLSWTSQSMFRLALTGYLPADSLRALARRVR